MHAIKRALLSRAERLDAIRIIKIAVGCCISIALSSVLGLEYSTAAGVITLLSIQSTKKETVRLALKRCGAFVVAVLIAWASFSLLGYTVVSFGVYLLLFAAFCFYLNMLDVLAICTVLISHFWVEQSMHASLMRNEAALIVIGTGVGVALNLFMPRRLKSIQKDQRKVEGMVRGILEGLSDCILRKADPHSLQPQMEQLHAMLQGMLTRAYENANNTFIADMRYYVQYTEMRMAQYTVLEKMLRHPERLVDVPEQAHILAAFFREISHSFHEYNNAVALLDRLGSIRDFFRQDVLPANRAEFELRAILFALLNDLEHFLLLKRSFAQSLGDEQKTAFWSS